MQVDHGQHTQFQSVAIAGLGLVGASIAGALREAHPQMGILGIDVSKSTCEKALEKGWVNRALAPEDPDLRRFACQECDLFIIATHAAEAVHYLDLLDEWGFDGLVTDTASTKQGICEHAGRVLSRPHMFIPGHPMAGSETNGIEGARSDLFEGAHWILCPDADTDPDAYTALHDLLSSLKARVLSLPREQHDQAVAIVSHVPHIVAASLVELATRHADEQQALLRLAAGGFKDSTRIAAGSPRLWCGISFDNKQALSQGLAEVSEIIGSFAQALDADDRQLMYELLDKSAHARRALPQKWLPSTDNLLEVRIPMQNRKGVVAEVTSIASQVGCNIQSIDIDHLTADSAVLSMILTDEGDIGKLSTQLIAAGFAVSLNPLSAKE